MSKKIVIVCALFLAVSIWLWQSERPKFGGGDVYNKYSSPTIASSSVATTWSTSAVVAGDSSRVYASFCNGSTSSVADIYLGLGATSTGVSGIKIPGNTCYEMTKDNMFTGAIYTIATPTVNTLFMIYK